MATAAKDLRPEADYPSRKAAQIRSAASVILDGIPLKLEKRSGGDLVKDYVPIFWCICEQGSSEHGVQDSPEHPCPCDTIVWVPAAAIRDRRALGRRGHDGEALTRYRVDPDAQIVVERTSVLRAQQLAASANGREPGLEPTNGRQPAARKPVGVKDAASAAFAIGVALGTMLDEAFGLSDKISDGLFDATKPILPPPA